MVTICGLVGQHCLSSLLLWKSLPSVSSINIGYRYMLRNSPKTMEVCLEFSARLFFKRHAVLALTTHGLIESQPRASCLLLSFPQFEVCRTEAFLPNVTSSITFSTLSGQFKYLIIQLALLALAHQCCSCKCLWFTRIKCQKC